MASKTTEETIKFEEAIENIREIIALLESGDLTLENSLAKYRDGSKLIEQCRTIINDAEVRITELSREGDTNH